MITEWARYKESKGMALNPQKSKGMVVAKQQNAERTVNISYKEVKLQLVSQYCYLGTIINSDGRIDNEIMNRVQKIYYCLLYYLPNYIHKKRGRK